jgi:Flp pilus assembly protein TadD
MGRDLQAIAQFAAAAKERPESPEPHVYLALVYANRSQFENAIAEVNQALAIDPITSNREFTNAVRMPFKESNLRDYLAFLRGKTAANRG